MEAKEVSKQVAQLMRRISDETPEDFAGLGLIVYSQLDELSHIPLHVPASDTKVVNAIGEEAVAGVLVHLSTLSSPWHDGFHFIRLADFRLTHVAQFVSPPVPADEALVPLERGARHMTAALASLVNGILLTAVLPAQGEVVLYKEGKKVYVKEAN